MGLAGLQDWQLMQVDCTSTDEHALLVPSNAHEAGQEPRPFHHCCNVAGQDLALSSV